MPKKKVAQPDLAVVAESIKGAAKTVVITNNQRRSWIAPKNLMGSVLTTTNNIVRPGCSIEVSKDEFDKFKKASNAFSYMLDNELLKASKARATLDMRDLKDAQPCKAPKHLASDGKVKEMTMSKTPVTITLEKSADEAAA